MNLKLDKLQKRDRLILSKSFINWGISLKLQTAQYCSYSDTTHNTLFHFFVCISNLDSFFFCFTDSHQFIWILFFNFVIIWLMIISEVIYLDLLVENMVANRCQYATMSQNTLGETRCILKNNTNKKTQMCQNTSRGH